MRVCANRIIGIAPVACSLAAFSIVILAVRTGRGMNGSDEGTSAHLFHLLIAVQAPMVLTYLITANWQRRRHIASIATLQACALLLAFAPVAFYRL